MIARQASPRAGWLVLGWALFFVLPLQPVVAQPSPLPTTPPKPLHEAPVEELRTSIATKHDQAKADLAAAEKELEAAKPDAVPPTLRERVELLRRLDATLAQQRSFVDRLDQLNEAKAKSEAEIERVRSAGLEGEGPFSFLDLERLRDDRAAREARRGHIDTVVKAAQDALEQSRTELAQAERASRALNDSVLTSEGDAKAALLAQRPLVELRRRVAAAVALLRALDLRVERLAERVFAIEFEALEERLTVVSRTAKFSAEDLKEILTEIEKESQRLRTRQDRLERTRARTSALPIGATPEQSEIDIAIRENLSREIASVGAQLERLSRAREVWEKRHRVANDAASRAEMREWLAATKEALDQLDLEKELLQARREELDGQVASVQDRLRTADDQAKVTLNQLLTALQYREEIQKLNAASMARLQSLQRKLITDLGEHVATFSLGERLGQIWSTVASVWTFQVFEIDERPITVGKICIGLFLLMIGFTVSRWGSGFLGRRLLPRLGLNEGVSGAVQSVSFYIFMLTFALFALRVANVPLTVFTLLGGAVAIGIGFGSQNVMNNFISGLILLAERPVRVGDTIQVGELYGNVERIGPRSTRVLTGDSLEIIVPNSSFLENNVVNWTLSTKRIRSSVKIGVAYGSPTRDVSRLLMRAAEEHGKVIKRPAPFVLFDDFGNDALAFEVFYWQEIRGIMDVRTLKSDLRFRIDHLFREANITIAFPQRDVHIDTVRPIEVRMVEPKPAAEAGPDTGAQIQAAQSSGTSGKANPGKTEPRDPSRLPN